MKQYVVCYAEPKSFYWPKVLLIEKKRPQWQSGRYNLPGGKIETDETIHEAAARELYEETGVMTTEVHIMGTIDGDEFVVYVCKCSFDAGDARNEAKSVTDERVFWRSLFDALRDPLLIDNLRIVIPFCHTGLVGWHIRTQDHCLTNITFEEISEKANVSEPLFFGPVG